jgi:hypothetical protein
VFLSVLYHELSCNVIHVPRGYRRGDIVTGDRIISSDLIGRIVYTVYILHIV